MESVAHPILSCKEAALYEETLLGSHEDAVTQAMQLAGDGIAQGILRDYSELTVLPRNPRLLVLVGKGHNGADALIAATNIFKARPRSSITVLLIWPQEGLKPLVKKALEELRQVAHPEVIGFNDRFKETFNELSEKEPFNICIDGILGMSFKLPLSQAIKDLLGFLNGTDRILFRASVDVPTGIGDNCAPIALRADFTYATGIAKEPIFKNENAPYVGRIRYIDIGFFKKAFPSKATVHLLTEKILTPLQSLRASPTDKRDYGHLFILGGSRHMPGALLMSVKAALRSGVGLVTVFAPKSMTPALAAQAPEAMWVPWDEDEDGFLMQQEIHILLDRMDKATALLIGPGLGSAMGIQGLVMDIVRSIQTPLMLDADALLQDVALTLAKRDNKDQAILMTPHPGEFKRLSGAPGNPCTPKDLQAFSQKHACFTLLKGPKTYIAGSSGPVYCSTHGGPVLARGGSGDVLAGVAGGLLAQPFYQKDPLKTLATAALWHGKTGDHLARTYGHRATQITDMIPLLDDALRLNW